MIDTLGMHLTSMGLSGNPFKSLSPNRSWLVQVSSEVTDHIARHAYSMNINDPVRPGVMLLAAWVFEIFLEEWDDCFEWYRTVAKRMSDERKERCMWCDKVAKPFCHVNPRCDYCFTTRVVAICDSCIDSAHKMDIDLTLVFPIDDLGRVLSEGTVWVKAFEIQPQQVPMPFPENYDFASGHPVPWITQMPEPRRVVVKIVGFTRCTHCYMPNLKRQLAAWLVRNGM